jgi:hypothetical protein
LIRRPHRKRRRSRGQSCCPIVCPYAAEKGHKQNEPKEEARSLRAKIARLEENLKAVRECKEKRLAVLSEGDLLEKKCKELDARRLQCEEQLSDLRLRQAVSEPGGILLFVPLSGNEGVNELVCDVCRYLALQDEKLLILDGRIGDGEDSGALPRVSPLATTEGNLRRQYSLIVMTAPAADHPIDTDILSGYADGVLVVVNRPVGSSPSDPKCLTRSLQQGGAPLSGAVVCD